MLKWIWNTKPIRYVVLAVLLVAGVYWFSEIVAAAKWIAYAVGVLVAGWGVKKARDVMTVDPELAAANRRADIAEEKRKAAMREADAAGAAAANAGNAAKGMTAEELARRL